MEGHVVRSRGIALLVAVGCSPPLERAPRFRHEAAHVVPIEHRDVGALHTSGAPPVDRAIDDALGAYAAVGQARLLDISGDGGDVLAIDRGDLVQLHADGGSTPRTTDLDVDWATATPDGTIIALADRDGNEATRLVRLAASASALLVEGHGRMTEPVARDQRIAWAEPDGATTTLWLRDHDGAVRKTFTGDGAWAPLDISRDGNQLLARRTVSVRSSAIYRIDVARGTALALTELDAATPSARFGHDDVVYAISDGGADRLGLWEITATAKRLVSSNAWDVTQLAISPEAKAVAFVTSEDGVSVLDLYDTVTRTQRIAPHGPTGGVISDLRWAAAAPVLAFSFSDPVHPRRVFTYDVATAQLVERTHVQLGALRANVVEPRRDRVASFDGTAIGMLVYLPPHPKTVLIELHGGPEDQWLPQWSAFEQFLAHRGIAVVMPNVRGSTGYGRGFVALDDGKHREDAVRDVGAVLDWIGRQPELGSSNVAIMGTSYGGYLALAALAAYPDRLSAGIDMVGITDFVGFLEGTRSDRRDQRRVEYGDERDPEVRAFLTRISPIAHAGAIRAPLLVAQGRLDPRVPPGAADRFVHAVRSAGGSVWYLVADDEGHGFTKPENRDAFEVLATQLIEATASRTSRK